MSTGAAALVVGVVAVVTYAMRSGLILLLADRPLPLVVERALRNVAPAVLAALVVNLVAGGGDGGPDIELAEALAVGVAVLVAWTRRHLLLALAAGMVTLWIVAALT